MAFHRSETFRDSKTPTRLKKPINVATVHTIARKVFALHVLCEQRPTRQGSLGPSPRLAHLVNSGLSRAAQLQHHPTSSAPGVQCRCSINLAILGPVATICLWFYLACKRLISLPSQSSHTFPQMSQLLTALWPAEGVLDQVSSTVQASAG